jgi:hypothetical protein
VIGEEEEFDASAILRFLFGVVSYASLLSWLEKDVPDVSRHLTSWGRMTGQEIQGLDN